MTQPDYSHEETMDDDFLPPEFRPETPIPPVPGADLVSMMADDAAAGGAPDSDKLSRLISLATEMVELEKAVEEAEEKLKQEKRKLGEMQLVKIPDLFDELNMSEIKLGDGTKISVNRSFVANITKEKESECFKWLEEHGHESIIKNVVTVTPKKGEEKAREELLEAVEMLQLSYDEKRSVHANTLKSFVREQIENGVDFPQELFGVFALRKTKVHK